MNNFYCLLNKSLNTNDIIEEDICLISHEPLNKYHVTLECGHKFNYLDIFNEVYKQKKQPSQHENQKLGLAQIKCPYCRNIQNTLLPPKLGYELIPHINKSITRCMIPNRCQYFTRNKHCGIPCFTKKCIKHIVFSEKFHDLFVLLQDFSIDLREINNGFVSELLQYLDELNNITETCNHVYKKGKNRGSICESKQKFIYLDCCKKHPSPQSSVRKELVDNINRIFEENNKEFITIIYDILK